MGSPTQRGSYPPSAGCHTADKLIFLSYCFYRVLPCYKALLALRLFPEEPNKLFSSILGDSCALWRLRCCPPAIALRDSHILNPAHQLLPDAFSLLNPTAPSLKQPRMSASERDCVPIKPYLPALTFEFHVIFTSRNSILWIFLSTI